LGLAKNVGLLEKIRGEESFLVVFEIDPKLGLERQRVLERG
jgi:hypothetical protein